MSRLDDELKSMFQRQEPSAGFAEQVLARINGEPQPKPSFWQTLVRFFQLPTMRWAVAAAAILLVAIIGVVQYQRLNKNAVAQQTPGLQENRPEETKVAQNPTTPKVVEDRSGIKNPERETTGGLTQADRVSNRNPNQHRQQRLKYRKETSVKNEEVLARQQKSAGEIAKEQLMKALFIASATVNEAKKVALGGD
jgi:hypothetical protein